ncbi:hypothetical protein AB0J80_35555 [Actinoplanes sp. NPDC049548]|uniref:hypothetical protein n=1 Tax=Actinoplanes sp. NPDC049548 TaxID=3155152 RepID=UPI0034391E04
MTDSTEPPIGDDDAGSSTDQYVTGAAEEGSFLTDEAPTPTTPAHGSSNAGINTTGANRPDAPGAGAED